MALEELHRWVGDGDEFTARHWRQAPAVLRPEPAPVSPMTLADVDAALAGGLLRTPHVEMARAEQPIPVEAYTAVRTVNGLTTPGFADPGKIRALLDQGATLLLRNTEQWHRATAELVGRIARDTERQVEAFVFVTPPGAQGLPLHRDDADVLLLQIAGSKRWSVHGGPDGGGWAPGPAAQSGPALLETTLRQGQVLYIPRGFAHAAVGDEGLSCHLSLTIREVGSQQLYRTLQHLLLDGLTLPARPLTEADLLDNSARLLAHFATRLDAIDPRHLLTAARRHQHRPADPTTAPGLVALAAALE
ncbi:cupin domain-containing protein [Kitasatospora sp. NPDC049258]|uniref:JmjC domain-containing protein n=1 Tax=Kitasatospora sp. NPDC049258 TaxID=3155394 RepID=UPI003413B3FC